MEESALELFFLVKAAVVERLGTSDIKRNTQDMIYQFHTGHFRKSFEHREMPRAIYYYYFK